MERPIPQGTQPHGRPTWRIQAFSWFARLQLRTATQLFRANVLVAAANFATSVLLARALDPDGRGELVNIILWPVLLSHFALAGVHMSLSRATAAKPTDAAKNYRAGLVAISLTSGLAIVLYGVAYLWSDQAKQAPHVLSGALFAALIIPFSAWNAFQIQMELGRHNLAYYNYGRASFAIGHLALVGILWFTAAELPNGYLFAFIATTMFAAVSTHVLIQHKLPTTDITGSTSPPLIDTFRTASPYALSAALITLATSADKITISLLFDARALGLYVVALGLAQVQSVFNEAVSPLFFARLAKKDRIDEVDPAWLGMRLRQTIIINGSIGLIMILTAPFLLPFIYGDAYSEATSLVMILVPAMCVRSMMRSFEEVLKGGNQPLSQSIAIITMTAVFASGAGIAAWAGTLYGVAFAQLIATLTGLGLVANAVARAASMRAANLLLPTAKDFSVLLSEAQGKVRR